MISVEEILYRAKTVFPDASDDISRLNKYAEKLSQDMRSWYGNKKHTAQYQEAKSLYKIVTDLRFTILKNKVHNESQLIRSN
jgi:hypothetical protein